jgi:hypothetical protein
LGLKIEKKNKKKKKKEKKNSPKIKNKPHHLVSPGSTVFS